MKTHKPALPVSTLALAYRNGSNYVLNNELYSDVPAGTAQLYRISESGQLSPVPDAEWDALARMKCIDRHPYHGGQNPASREVPTE